MEVVKGFFDLCINEECIASKESYETTIRTLYDYGYRTVAINQKFNEEDVEPKKKKKKGEPREVNDVLPAPKVLTEVKGCEDMKLLNRLTISFKTQDILHKVTKSPLYKKYNLIGVLPMTPQAFQYVVGNFDADIFCFNPEGKDYYKLNRKSYKQIVDKGMHFEILYSPAILDTTQRRNTIHTSHLYHSFGKSRNIILSSGAIKSHLIRGPYDIVNLGLIFGLNAEQSKNAITHCGRKVYIHSVGRRHGKAVMLVETITKELKEATMESEAEEEDEEASQPAQKKLKS